MKDDLCSNGCVPKCYSGSTVDYRRATPCYCFFCLGLGFFWLFVVSCGGERGVVYVDITVHTTCSPTVKKLYFSFFICVFHVVHSTAAMRTVPKKSGPHIDFQFRARISYRQLNNTHYYCNNDRQATFSCRPT